MTAAASSLKGGAHYTGSLITAATMRGSREVAFVGVVTISPNANSAREQRQVDRALESIRISR